MNNSGNAVASICAYYSIEPDHVIVVHDDMDWILLCMKVKAGGSAGGHNGIKSIDRSLGTPQYGRAYGELVMQLGELTLEKTL